MGSARASRGSVELRKDPDGSSPAPDTMQSLAQTPVPAVAWACWSLHRLCAIALICFVATSLPAAAQLASNPANVGVMERLRPDYDAKGVDLGGFRLFPALDVNAAAADNVFQNDAPESDVYFEFVPALRLTSEWSQHALELSARLSANKYLEQSSEDVVDSSVGGSGRLDIRRGSAFFVNLSHAKLHEERSSPNLPGNIAEPARFSLTHVDGTLAIQPNRVGVALAAQLDRYSYEDVPLIGGGILDTSDRDRDHYRLSARLSYDFAAGYMAFVRTTYDLRRYDLKFDGGGVERDSHGLSFDTGLELNLARLLRGQIFAGYLEQHFALPLQDVSGASYGAALSWYATPLITVRLGAQRALSDTTLPGVSVSDDRSFVLGADYEVLRDLIARASATFVEADFVGSSREDSSKRAELNLIYFVNRHVSATARYTYQERESSIPTQDFTENTFNAGLHFQL